MASRLVLLKTSREDSRGVNRLVTVSGNPATPPQEGGGMSEQDEAYRSEEKKDDFEAHELKEELKEKHGEPTDKESDDFEAHELKE
jgi:hypothetical protein